MTYVMSDLHGAYERYDRMLRLIDFSDNDTLFVLGDIVDRGEKPAEILLDMMSRTNVYPIMGNHDCMAMYFLELLSNEMAEHDFSRHMNEDDTAAFACWLSEGGRTTFDGLCRLSTAERVDILEYMQGFPLYEIVDSGERTFFLVHAGLGGFRPDKKLSEYTAEELIMSRNNPKTRFFDDDSVYVVMGHTPTPLICGEAVIYHCGNNIYIDCGAYSPDGRLACLCLDNMKEYYVE